MIIRYWNLAIAILCFSCIAILQPLHAQGTEDEGNYDFQNWRVILQLSGPTNWNASINFVKPLSAKWAFRFGFSPLVSFNRTKGSDNNSPSYIYYDDLNKSKKLGAGLTLGAEYHFLSNLKLDPYILMGNGCGIFVESSNRTTAYELADPVPGGYFKYESNTTSKGAPQFAFDPFAGFGFNYFFNPQMAIGAEYSIGPSMILLKGKTKRKTRQVENYLNGDELIFTSEDE